MLIIGGPSPLSSGKSRAEVMRFVREEKEEEKDDGGLAQLPVISSLSTTASRFSPPLETIRLALSALF